MTPVKHSADKFAINLKEALDFLGMSQKEIAEKSGLTEAAISQYIGGQRQPELKAICAIMNVIPIKFERLVR